MSTISTANVRATKATKASAKKESGKTLSSNAHVANTPNAETLATFADVEAGNVKSFDSVRDMMVYLKNAED